MKNIFDTMNDIEVQVGETTQERVDFLSKSVNDFIDNVYFASHSILHQTLSPVHGFTYEEMRRLVDAMETFYQYADDPVAICVVDVLESLAKAQKQGYGKFEDIMGKIVALGKDDSTEICYRVYVYLRLKQIMIECFEEF